MQEFLERQRTPENYWRAVILFGQNVASCKFALAKSLIDLSERGQDLIKLEDLAEPFWCCNIFGVNCFGSLSAGVSLARLLGRT